MNITPFPTLSTATIDAINVIGQWLAQDDFSGEMPYQADCVILAGNAVMPTIDAACKIARDQQIPLLISGGIGHSTTFLYSAMLKRAFSPQFVDWSSIQIFSCGICQN